MTLIIFIPLFLGHSGVDITLIIGIFSGTIVLAVVGICIACHLRRRRTMHIPAEKRNGGKHISAARNNGGKVQVKENNKGHAHVL